PSAALIVAWPAAMPRTRPCVPGAFDAVAIAAFDDVQITWVVRSCVESSEKTPVATRRPDVPEASDRNAGEISSETRVGAPTVTAVEPVAPRAVHDTCATPALTPVNRPVPATVATAGASDDHAQSAVTSASVWSDSWATAFMPSVVPFARLGPSGESEIDTTVAALTVTVAEPVTPPYWQVIDVVPAAAAVTRPVAATIAAIGTELFHEQSCVTSSELPSLKMPVAVSCSLLPAASVLVN